MKTMIRAALTLILVVTAVVMALRTAALFRARPVTESGDYLVAEEAGCVAVYDLLDRRRPLEVTDIALDSLRDRDRELIRQGLPVEGREALLELLEDLGR